MFPNFSLTMFLKCFLNFWHFEPHVSYLCAFFLKKRRVFVYLYTCNIALANLGQLSYKKNKTISKLKNLNKQMVRII